MSFSLTQAHTEFILLYNMKAISLLNIFYVRSRIKVGIDKQKYRKWLFCTVLKLDLLLMAFRQSDLQDGFYIRYPTCTQQVQQRQVMTISVCQTWDRESHENTVEDWSDTANSTTHWLSLKIMHAVSSCHKHNVKWSGGADKLVSGHMMNDQHRSYIWSHNVPSDTQQ